MKPKTIPHGVTALAGWFGSNRMLAHEVGQALAGCSWAGVVFAGGMSEVPHITARTIVCNDRHRAVMNLARVVASDQLRPALIRAARRKVFHPDELAAAQDACLWRLRCEAASVEVSGTRDLPDLDYALDYFVCCWMGRGGKAGLDSEFNGRPAVRWKADGGDSMVRYQSAIRMLVTFARCLRRCTFETMDAFDFLARCEDLPGHGVYNDPPFPEVGRKYRHNAGQSDAAERIWHTRLRDALVRFETTRVVCRFYRHPLIEELYAPVAGWHWLSLTGRKQTNADADEVLVLRNHSPAQAKLF